MMLKTKSLWLAAWRRAAAGPAVAQITAPREAAQIEFGPVVAVSESSNCGCGSRRQRLQRRHGAAARLHADGRDRECSACSASASNELMFQTGNDYVWFREFELRAIEQRAILRCASTCRQADSSRSSEPSTSARGARRGPEIDARARRIDRIVVGGLGFDLTPRTSLTASARFDDVEFEDGESLPRCRVGRRAEPIGPRSGGRRALRRHAADDAQRPGRI